MAGKLRHIAVGNNTYDLQGGNLRIFYGTCSTGATAQIKIVNIPEVTELETGDVFYIKMANAQTYNGIPKLQINSFEEKTIARTGSDNASRYEWQAGEILEFLYDGTSMVLVDGAIADTTYYGLTKLSSAVDSNSEAVAATSRAVKTAYDAATTPVSGATATQPGAAGIVPQPVAGDQVKFLRGDGTWVENSGSVLTVNNVVPDVSKNVQLNDENIPSTVDGKSNVEQVLSSHSQQIDNLDSDKTSNISIESVTASTLEDFLKTICNDFYNNYNIVNKPVDFIVTWNDHDYYTGMLRKRGTYIYCMMYSSNNLISCMYNTANQVLNLNNINQQIVNIGNGLASPTATGSTNNTGSTITKNTYFRLDGILCIALANIANGATFTSGTNYRVVTEGGLNAVNTLLGGLFKIVSTTQFISDSDLTAGKYGLYTGTITIPEGYKSLTSVIVCAHPALASGLVFTTPISHSQSGTITYYGSYYTPKAISRVNADYVLSIICIKNDYNLFI